MRDDDPATGRYLQADPLGLVDGASVYGYALGNPLVYVDPKGEFAFPLAGLVLGAIAGGVAGYISGGCWQAIAIGALAGGLAGMVFPNVALLPDVGSMLGGTAGSAAGQAAVSVFDVCCEDGPSIPSSWEEANDRARFDP